MTSELDVVVGVLVWNLGTRGSELESWKVVREGDA